MTVSCIVCETELDRQDVFDRIEDEEEHVYFCSRHCREQFEEDPELFVEQEAVDRRRATRA